MMIEAIGQLGGTVYGITWSRPVESEPMAARPVEPVDAVDSGSVAEEAWLEALASMVRGGAVVFLDRPAGAWSNSEGGGLGLRRRLDRVYRAESSEQPRWQPPDLAQGWSRPSVTHRAPSADASHGSDFRRIVSTLEQAVDRHLDAAAEKAPPDRAERLRSLADRLRENLYQTAERIDAAGTIGPDALLERVERGLERELSQLEAVRQATPQADRRVDEPDEAGVLETLRQAFAVEVHHLRQSLAMGQVRPADQAARSRRSVDRVSPYTDFGETHAVRATGHILNAVA